MILKTIDGSEFELQIAGYQFPEIQDEEWDSNWLLIRVLIHTETHTWEAIDPCMDTYEANNLCKWLNSLAEGQTVQPELEFLEPELRFKAAEITDNSIEVEIQCRYNLAPLETSRTYNYEQVFQFSLDRQSIRQAAKDWCSEVQKFPTRVQRK